MKSNFFIGVVEDRDDPLKLGRVRVRIFGMHSANKNDIKTIELPWSSVMMPVNSAGISEIGMNSNLLPGSWVIGMYLSDYADATQCIVLGSIPSIPTMSSNPNVGFNDPSGIYPIESKLNESDLSRLARNEKIDQTIVALKKAARDLNVPNADGSTWNEPENPYNSQYPFNEVRQTESGHIEEFDNTPGAERIHRYHKSGSFEEIHPNGSKVTKVVKDSYELIAGDGFVNIKGDCNITVNGDGKILIKGDANIKVQGNVQQTVGGTMDLNVVEDLTIASGTNIQLIAPRIDLN